MDQAPKIALVAQLAPSAWVSCRTITRNLRRAYGFAFPEAEIQVFALDRDMTSYELFQEARRLRAFAPTRIAFVDHAPHPARFIRCLAESFAPAALPEVVIHVFGDFTLHASQWLSIASILERANARFVCASERQTALIRKLVQDDSKAPGGAVVTAPFPIDRSEYSFSPDVRREPREVDQDRFVFLYTGRLSHQKNILHVITAFSGYLTKFDSNAALWLAGSIDDLGAPYMGRVPPPGSHAYEIQSLIDESISPKWPGRVKCLGEQDKDALRELYHRADAFVSLSAHNDEDFGMAPAEAACSGLPLILTDWGGYAGFSRLGADACRMVPVRLCKDRVLPSLQESILAFFQVSSHRRSTEDRKALSKTALDWLSCEAVGLRLRSILSEASDIGRFAGFSPVMRQLDAAFLANPDAPFERLDQFTPLYRSLYETYV